MFLCSCRKVNIFFYARTNYTFKKWRAPHGFVAGTAFQDDARRIL